MRVLLVSLFFGLATSTYPGEYLENGRKNGTANFPVYAIPVVKSKTVQQVGQPSSIQSQAKSINLVKESEQKSDIVSTINSRIPTLSNHQNIQTPISGSHFGQPPNNFQPSQFLGSKSQNQATPNYSVNPGRGGTKGSNNFSPSAQRRVDFEDDFDDHSYGYGDDEEINNSENEQLHEYQGSGNKYQYKDHYPKEVGDQQPPPETRESQYLGFPASGPGFVGPAPFDPLPPPPQQIKGSVDYILIPLVLIGIAGPIFVVLYVILGAFEAKLSPITRSLGGFDAYKPYLDNLMTSVGRALDQSECMDYAVCKLGSFGNQLGYTSTYPLLEQSLDSLTPTPYKRNVRKLFETIQSPEECSFRSCIRFPV